MTGVRPAPAAAGQPGVRVAGLARTPSRRRLRQAAVLAAALLFTVSVASGLQSTTALFTNGAAVGSVVQAKRIFGGERVTSGFIVTDVSGGTVVDRSSPFALPGDLRTVTSKPWTAAFGSGRFLQFDLSDPLPGGLAVASPVFRLTFAAGGAAATACVYVEVRRLSTDAVIATHGSAGSPSACATGTTPVTLALAVPEITGTDSANDLRVRVFGRESAAGSMTVDEARFTGSTPYITFSTYPVRFTDAADGVLLVTPWDLQGP